MPSNGRVAGKLVVQMDLQSAGFMNSATGINKAIRSMRSNLKTLDKFYKANGDEVGRLSQKYKQSSQLMTTYREKVKGLKSELKGLKPNTQAFVQQQNQIRRTEADMAQLSNEMKAYRKQLLYQDSALQKTNAKYKQQASVINSSISRYKAEGNALKQSIAERRKVKNSIDQHNASIRSNEKILNRIRVVMGKNSAEYAEQRSKLKAIKAETASYNAQLTQTTQKMKAMAVQQRASNSAMGRAMLGMQKNKAGLIDMRNSFMGLTAAAVGMAYPVARALGGAVKATIDWEDAQANVQKTTNASQAEMKQLSSSIMGLSKVMPESQQEIGNTMAMAAQLGISGTKNLTEFTKIATQMGVATDMSSEEAATAMARMANVTGMPTSKMKNLGSTVVNLGNNMAAQESEIMNFSQRLSGTGTTVGLAEKDIVALGSAMAGVGINAEAGGSAMSKVMSKINNAVMNGGEKLEGFAKVSGMTATDFAALWKKDPYQAIQQFEKGIKQTNDSGQNYKKTLEGLGITELRETDTVLRLANGNKQLADARKYANDGWAKGTALSQEAETKYKTLGNQMKIFMNHVRALGIEIGSALAPILIKMMKVLTPIIDALAKAPAPIKLMVVALGLIPIVAVPVLGSLAAITGAMGLMGQAMNTATNAAGRNSKALRIYAASVGLLTSPIKTTKKALSSLPGIFGKVGKSAQSGTKNMSSTGTVLTKTGSQASRSGSLFSKFAGKLKFLAPIGSMLTGVLGALLSALAALSAPVLIVAAVVGTLVTAFVVAYKKVGWFRDGINGLLYVFKVFGGNIISGAINKVKDFGKWAGDVAGNVGGWISDKFKSMWKAMAGTSFGKATKKNFDSFKNAMKTLGTASQKSTDQVKVLGKGVSEGTKKALKNYIKYSEDSTRVMAQIKNNNGKVTKEMQEQLVNATRKGGEEAVKQVKSRNKKISNQLNNMLKDSKAFTQSEKNDMISKNQQASDEKVKKLESLNDEIAALEEKQFNDGKLTDKESAKLKSKLDERNKLTIKYLSQGQKEQQAILSRLNANTGALDTQEAADAIKESIKARNKAIKEAKKQRTDDTIEADSLLDSGAISKKEHDKRIKEINKQYDETKKEADKKAGEIKGNIKKNNEDIDSEIDMSTGKAYTGAEKWWKQYTNGVKKRFNDSMGSLVDFGAWIIDVKAKADNFWNQFGSAFSQRMSEAWGRMSKNASNFGKNFIEGLVNIGQWIMDVKVKADSFWNSFGSTIMSGLNIAGGWISSQTKQFGTALVNGIMNIGSWIMQVKAKADSFWNQFGTTLFNAAVGIGQWFYGIGAKIWNGIKQGWDAIINSNPGALWAKLTSALGTAWEATKQWFITKGQQMGSALSQGWAAMKGFVVNTFSSIWTSIKTIWSGIWGTISYWTGAIWNRVKSVWSWIKNNTTLVFTSVWNFIKWIWTSIKNTIVYWTGAIWNRIKGVWGWIKSHTVGAFTFVWNTIKRIWSGIKNTIVYWTSAIWNRVKSVWSWIKSNTLGAFTYVWNTIKRIWAGIKGTIVYWTSAIWNRVKAVWNWIKSNTASAFTWIWNKIKSIWSGIKGTITYWTGAIWGRIKAVWSWIKSHTSQVFSSVWNKIKEIWKGIKGTISYWAGAAWNKVKSIWNSLSKGTKDIFNGVKNYLTDKWNSIKDSVTGIVSKLWGSVKDTFTNMKDGIKGFAGKIGDTINDMVGGIKTGLNALIKGVNWVAGKLGVDKKIPKLSTGTESTHTQSFVSNGAISRPTLATVNDKGLGNGSGSSGHQELIQRANGQVFAPKGKDVTVPLGKGDRIINGRDTQRLQKSGAIPKFAKGLGSGFATEKMLKDIKKKKKKKDDEEHGAMDAIGSRFGVAGGGESWQEKLAGGLGTAVGKGHKAKKKVVAGAKAGAKVASDKIGELLDYVGKPGKLVDAVLGKFGVDFGKVKGEIPKDMMWDPMWKGLKGGVKSLFDGWLTEADGAGDGSYIDLSKGINYGFGHPPGYPFPGGHSGIDINYKYGDKLYSVMSGNAVGTTGWGGGFGRHMEITSGDTKAIYGHMSKLAFNKKRVKPGDYIGNSGGDPGRDGINAGQSTGAHLHFEVQKNGKPIDPIPWLKKNNGGGSKNKKASAWKDDIKRAAKQMKVSLKGNDLNNIVSLINAESGGNAGVTQGNIGDINNRNGNPAQGLLQYIPQTFSAYAMKGHKNIKNGYDQLLAFFNNKYWRSQFNPNGGWSPSGPRRYAHGGMIKKHGLYEAGEGNREEMILPLTNKVRAMQLIEQAKSFMGVNDEGSISTVDNNSSDDIITQLLQQNNRLLEALINTVENKELVVDKNSIVETANNGLGRMHRNKKYTKGGY